MSSTEPPSRKYPVRPGQPEFRCGERLSREQCGLSYGVIAREETYMGQKFGDEYLRYRAAVRRWV